MPAWGQAGEGFLIKWAGHKIQCNFEQATKLLPVDDLDDGYELEIKEGIMKVLQFYDGDRGLRHYVACYQYELQQSPESWSYE
ncbi:hypothetical protein EUZ85_23360 [Hahella sp. KA22]|uniref:hypothetical protein n=1 Tax=Hahella sp. KA22 TaxID=1628392 RepID=UPI000FDE466A|nr:hypothetical protein [Hahella sp. KA22]AZZ93500.1 hypothetical protein ENC22_20780 [Hahella sp. KA22]QAY56874.1 hypothetical protein EUZ85_23360 [Hahella sp. KA22]